MAFDTTKPAQANAALTDIAAILENLLRLRDNERGAGAPANEQAGQLWVDSSGASDITKQRDSADAAWVDLWDELYPPKAHREAATLDHPALSVTTAKINNLAVTTGKLADGAVTPVKMNIGSGEVSTIVVAGENLLLPGGHYGFYPEIKSSDAAGVVTAQVANADVPGIAYVNHIFIATGNVAHTAYAQQYYVTASGREPWIFAVVEKLTGKILSAWYAKDHPQGHPHPFISRKGDDPAIEISLLGIKTSWGILRIAERLGVGVLEVLHRLRVDLSREIPWTPRDMDGHQTLMEPHPSYRVRTVG